MSENSRSATLRHTLRACVTFALFFFCFVTEDVLFPTYLQVISISGVGILPEWATAPLGLMRWVVGLVMVGGTVLTVRTEKEAQASTAATALAVVDVVLVLWVTSIWLILFELAFAIPSLG